MTDAYEQGREAYYRGDEAELNPYDDADAQWEQWRDGFWGGWLEYTLSP